MNATDSAMVEDDLLSTRARNALRRELGIHSWEPQAIADKLAQVPYDVISRWPDVGKVTLEEFKDFLVRHEHCVSNWNLPKRLRVAPGRQTDLEEHMERIYSKLANLTVYVEKEL